MVLKDFLGFPFVCGVIDGDASRPVGHGGADFALPVSITQLDKGAPVQADVGNPPPHRFRDDGTGAGAQLVFFPQFLQLLDSGFNVKVLFLYEVFTEFHCQNSCPFPGFAYDI